MGEKGKTKTNKIAQPSSYFVVTCLISKASFLYYHIFIKSFHSINRNPNMKIEMANIKQNFTVFVVNFSFSTEPHQSIF